MILGEKKIKIFILGTERGNWGGFFQPGTFVCLGACPGFFLPPPVVFSSPHRLDGHSFFSGGGVGN